MYENLSDFCESNNEEVEDVLFSMLTTLFDEGKAELAKKSTLCGQNRLKMF